MVFRDFVTCWCLLCGLMLLVFTMPVTGGASVEDATAIDDFVESQMRRSRLPGVSVVIVNPEQQVYSGSFSLKNSLDETRITADTPFFIGSVTKTFTALAIAQLADAGKLHFDDPVVVHLPDFSLEENDEGRMITLRHLLTHTSGLRQWSGHDPVAQQEARFGHISPVRPPGVSVEYSSLNYIILGIVVEAVSDMSYAEYVQHHIFDALDMQNSFTDLQSARENGLVDSYWYLYGLTIPGQETQQPDPLVPAGFLISSARDMGNYLSMLLNEGRFRGQQIVSPETLNEMFTPWNDGETGVGMGWGIGSTQISHAGSTPTFSARAVLLPEQQFGVVVLANVNSGPFFSGTAALMDGVVNILGGESVGPIRPDEILLKVAILILLIVSVLRMLFRLRQWSRRGFPYRLVASRGVAMPLVIEAGAAILILLIIPRLIGVPLFTLLEYFPDLAIAMLVGVITGFLSALMRSFMLSDETLLAKSI